MPVTADGFTIIHPGITIRGLAIDGFVQGAGILISGPDRDRRRRVSANYIGTDLTGTIARPNAIGISIEGNARDNTIGGSTAAAGNLIADNVGLWRGRFGRGLGGQPHPRQPDLRTTARPSPPA